ncbi:hypothetical protein SHKM778_77510 [Streptomyces sp. KM77-8]|uniref:Glycerol operon regulatory protein n=1 Tax=Streptomyces haneummycinicus TaxID=3074435 RepID=A0AAT9HVS2_9ACTN
MREVKSAARTMEVLELLAARGDRPARLQELADELSVPRSSMYALLQTLIARGWVRTDVTGSLYGIGIRALLTGTSYLDSDPRVRAVRPYLDEASDALGETIHLGRLDGHDVAYLATRESHEYLRTISRVGRRLPAHVGALGKALLAERPDGELPPGRTRRPRRTPTPRGSRWPRIWPGCGSAATPWTGRRGAGDRRFRVRPAVRLPGPGRHQLLGAGGAADGGAGGADRRRDAGDPDEAGNHGSRRWRGCSLALADALTHLPGTSNARVT